MRRLALGLAVWLAGAAAAIAQDAGEAQEARRQLQQALNSLGQQQASAISALARAGKEVPEALKTMNEAARTRAQALFARLDAGADAAASGEARQESQRLHRLSGALSILTPPLRELAELPGRYPELQGDERYKAFHAFLTKQAADSLQALDDVAAGKVIESRRNQSLYEVMRLHQSVLRTAQLTKTPEASFPNLRGDPLLQDFATFAAAYAAARAEDIKTLEAWDGRNDAGVQVSKGGYVARIKVKATGGSATAIRKIGVIH